MSILLLLEGLILDLFTSKCAEVTFKRLHSLILSGATGEIVKVEKVGKLSRYFPRAHRKAKGLRTYNVEYNFRMDESFEAYLFVLPKSIWNIFAQSRFIIPKAELDKARAKDA